MFPKEINNQQAQRPPGLKINNQGNHGWGTKGIWGDQRDVIVAFGPPKIIVLSLKFRLQSPANNCFVPSNSKSFVVPPK